jgi:hypothetical protein
MNMAVQAAPPDGGMYPISMLNKLPLKKAGLRISASDIFNPNGVGTLQAIVQLGGCTASFVSGEGLMITNHHCAFSSLGPYSSPDNNLLEKGYLAKDRKHELPMRGLTCKIMESYKDVSEEVLKGTEHLHDALAKRKLIDENIDRIKQAEQLKTTELLIDISEMLPGKNYIMFRYKTIKDVRIVFVPARNIGEFGGETDNWEWPRHTGDFSFVRAYVGKNGESNTFDSSNVPYEPKEYLNINSKGTNEGDFVFILGYPGRTYRHQPAEFIKYQEQYTLPFISELYEWQINTVHQLGKDDKAFKIHMDPRIKSLANVAKNFEGKLQGIQKLDLYNEKKKEEQHILTKLDPATQKEFRTILYKVDSLYAKVEENYSKYLWYSQLMSENTFIKMAHVVDYLKENAKQKATKEEQADRTGKSIKLLREYYRGIYWKYDTLYLKKMLKDGMAFKDKDYLSSLHNEVRNEDFNKWFTTTVQKSILLDTAKLFFTLNKPSRLKKLNEPFITLAHSFYYDYRDVDSVQAYLKIQLDNLRPRYVDIKMQVMNEEFVPDANSTLRLTYGYIKGYAPRDAVYYKPQTYVSGMVEKDGLEDDYVLNKQLAYIFKQGAHSPFHTAQNDVPLCMLYNTDTTGGNSGSPVLNKYGQLIGLNFDRCYEATINDYAWDDKYSRSIGLDIRFVLWELSKVEGAKNLMNEMFIDE